MALASKTDPLFDNFAHLKTFPDHILRDIARNDCAEHDYRKHAVEILVVRKSPLAKHPDLQSFVDELDVELEGIQFEHPDLGPGPLVAGVTTKTMFADDLVTSIQKIEPSPNFPDAPPSDSVSIPQPDDPQEVVSEIEPEIIQAKPKRQRKSKETPSDATQ